MQRADGGIPGRFTPRFHVVDLVLRPDLLRAARLLSARISQARRLGLPGCGGGRGGEHLDRRLGPVGKANGEHGDTEKRADEVGNFPPLTLVFDGRLPTRVNGMSSPGTKRGERRASASAQQTSRCEGRGHSHLHPCQTASRCSL